MLAYMKKKSSKIYNVNMLTYVKKSSTKICKRNPPKNSFGNMLAYVKILFPKNLLEICWHM